MAKTPEVGDVQNMFTRASIAAMVLYTGAAFSLVLLLLSFVNPEIVRDPVSGSVLGVMLFAGGLFMTMMHQTSLRSSRTIMSVTKLDDGKTQLTVRYRDGVEKTVDG